MCQAFFEFIKKKRNSLLCGRRLSKKFLNLIETIEMVKKGECVNVPVENEREAHNIRSWIANNRELLRPDVRDVRTSYKKAQNLLYIYIE